MQYDGRRIPASAGICPDLCAVAAAGRGTEDESLYLLSLIENRRAYVRCRFHICVCFPVTGKTPQVGLRLLPAPAGTEGITHYTLHGKVVCQRGAPLWIPPAFPRLIT